MRRDGRCTRPLGPPYTANLLTCLPDQRSSSGPGPRWTSAAAHGRPLELTCIGRYQPSRPASSSFLRDRKKERRLTAARTRSSRKRPQNRPPFLTLLLPLPTAPLQARLCPDPIRAGGGRLLALRSPSRLLCPLSYPPRSRIP